jgi:hypothetical protein
MYMITTTATPTAPALAVVARNHHTYEPLRRRHKAMRKCAALAGRKLHDSCKLEAWHHARKLGSGSEWWFVAGHRRKREVEQAQPLERAQSTAASCSSHQRLQQAGCVAGGARGSGARSSWAQSNKTQGARSMGQWGMRQQDTWGAEHTRR